MKKDISKLVAADIVLNAGSNLNAQIAIKLHLKDAKLVDTIAKNVLKDAKNILETEGQVVINNIK